MEEADDRGETKRKIEAGEAHVEDDRRAMSTPSD